VKVLFVGEGKSDIGPAEFGEEVRPARGTVFGLVRKIIPDIEEDSPALAWTELRRFHPSGKKHGFEAKVSVAILISARRFGCKGTVCVTDCDGHPSRLAEMERGQDHGLAVVGDTHGCACGLAVEAIEVWTLGAREAIADVLDVAVGDVINCYPKGKHIEDLSKDSGKLENRPKVILEKIAQLKHQVADVKFREAVASRTDVGRLEDSCPKGFKPFAKALREASPLVSTEGKGD
jgi:hypothetical protein